MNYLKLIKVVCSLTDLQSVEFGDHQIRCVGGIDPLLELKPELPRGHKAEEARELDSHGKNCLFCVS